MTPEQFRDRNNRLLTPNFEILPLTGTEFEDYLWVPDAVALSLKLDAVPEPLDLEVQEALEWLHGRELDWEEQKADDVWKRPFLIIRRATNCVVGRICFKSPPIKYRRHTEIAYDVDREERRRGVMSEALPAVIDWARARKNVDAITAETDELNDASRRVLEKTGFKVRVDRSRRGLVSWEIRFAKLPPKRGDQ